MVSKGKSQSDIARTLQVAESTISNDLDYLGEESKQNIQKYIDNILPLEYEKTLAGLTAILKEMWSASEKADIDIRESVIVSQRGLFHEIRFAQRCLYSRGCNEIHIGL